MTSRRGDKKDLSPTLDELCKEPDRIVELFEGEERYRQIFYTHDETPEGRAFQSLGLPNVVPPPDCLTIERLESCMADIDAKIVRLQADRLDLKQKLFEAYLSSQQDPGAFKDK